MAWKAAVPCRGHSSPIIVGSTVYVATVIYGRQQQIVIAFDRATVKRRCETVIHESGLPKATESYEKGTNANPSLAPDEKHVFAAMSMENGNGNKRSLPSVVNLLTRSCRFSTSPS